MSRESSTEPTATSKEKLERLRQRVKEELIHRLGEEKYKRIIYELREFKREFQGKPPPKTQEQIRREVMRAIGEPISDDYFSGIPGSMRSMGPDKIIAAYEIIKTNSGNQIAEDFMRMIMDMPSLAPINILQTLRRLMENNWIYEDGYTEHVLERATQTHPVGSITHEGAVLGAYVARDMPDETEQIKAAIRQRLGDTLGEDVRHVTIDSTPLV